MEYRIIIKKLEPLGSWKTRLKKVNADGQEEFSLKKLNQIIERYSEKIEKEIVYINEKSIYAGYEEDDFYSPPFKTHYLIKGDYILKVKIPEEFKNYFEKYLEEEMKKTFFNVKFWIVEIKSEIDFTQIN